MPETQNIEWKSNWHNDYLKWICGFANASGGKIYIGTDDNGKIIGVKNYKSLMESIPNQIQSALGILTNVNLLSEGKLYYIEIDVRLSSVPVSLRGRYYFRSGSTKKELTGNTLNEFLLKKMGNTWDNIIETSVTLDSIDPLAIDTFLKAVKESGRFPDMTGLSNKDILEKLGLLVDAGLKRAALVLFAKNPAQFFPNTMVKIGRFADSDADLRFQEVVEGNLIKVLEETLDILNNKFLIRPVSFEGIQRIERHEYPTAALREMLLNALVHRNYMGSMIQIKVYDHKISIWNEGLLPEGMTSDSLKKNHPSRPRNPLVADACFKAGYIDSWGRGTLKIIEVCDEASLLEPDMDEAFGGF